MSATPAEQFRINAAAGAAKNPATWRSLAESLRNSAEAVLQAAQAQRAAWWNAAMRLDSEGLSDNDLFMGRVFILLMGLAIENLAKGIGVAKDPSLVKSPGPGNMRLFKWPNRAHVSVALFDRCGIALDPRERDLVERLGRFVEWGGRYPVPMNPLDMRNVADPSGAVSPPIHWSDRDIGEVQALYQRLCAEWDSAAISRAEQNSTTSA